ncbi:MAG TPA: response regulator [Allocoleopsis sp.]
MVACYTVTQERCLFESRYSPNTNLFMSKILVIEDEQHIRTLINDILTLEDFEVIEAEDGNQGLNLALDELPDLIICDIMMPELDGYEILKKLQENSRTKAIPFIFLTAKVTKDNMRYGMNLGADDYITKPFEEAELLTSVRTRLQKYQTIEDYYHEEVEKLRINISVSLPHELKTPLSGILISAELLLAKLDEMDKEKIRKITERIYNHGERLNNLIYKYLSYVKIQSIANNNQEIQKLRSELIRGINAQKIMENTSKKKANQFGRENDLKLHFESIKEVFINEEHLEQVMIELVDNAFKFSQNGQSVEIITQVENSQLIISIINYGRQMNSQQIEQIGAFMQFDRDIYEQQGSGLGLAIAQSIIVKLYGGNFTVKSSSEEGTIVTISLR